ncbi:F-box protein At2g23160-like [Papaver somniferum]|nr:F-box protein At2g23160-like [Papaver somniferum]
MVGSCNGLACFRARGIDRFLICNPLTGESIFHPEFLEGIYHSVGSGFGYCPSTNSYKVVTIFYHHRGEQKGYIHVYTIGGKWRSIEYIGRRKFGYSTGIYANGALYWWHQYDFYGLKESEIVAFDLEGEKFHSILMPRFKYEYSGQLKLLGENNNLYLAYTS